MTVCVQGLWHLGTVTAACLAAAGKELAVFGLEAASRADVGQGVPPLNELGLALESLREGGCPGN
jgi:UDPglucose 6-dehydrogenase